MKITGSFIVCGPKEKVFLFFSTKVSLQSFPDIIECSYLNGSEDSIIPGTIIKIKRKYGRREFNQELAMIEIVPSGLVVQKSTDHYSDCSTTIQFNDEKGHTRVSINSKLSLKPAALNLIQPWIAKTVVRQMQDRMLTVQKYYQNDPESPAKFKATIGGIPTLAINITIYILIVFFTAIFTCKFS